ncbi:hypothetical protein GW820_06405 [archaeon]|nr:hypothetical protein [archaeon]
MSVNLFPKKITENFILNDYDYQDKYITTKEFSALNSDVQAIIEAEPQAEVDLGPIEANISALQSNVSTLQNNVSGLELDLFGLGITVTTQNINLTNTSNNLSIGSNQILSDIVIGKTAGTQIIVNQTNGIYPLKENADNTNSIMGYNTGLNITGARNTCYGSLTCQTLTTGEENTLIGYDVKNSGINTLHAVGVGSLITAASNCTCIGYASRSTANNGTAIGAYSRTSGGINSMALGFNAGSSGSPFNLDTSGNFHNTIVIGDNNITDIYVKVALNITSDARDKANITPLNDCYGLEFINKLNVKTYQFDDRTRYLEGATPGSLIDEKIRIGLLAQEVLQAETESGCNENISFVNSKNPEKLSLNETQLIYSLIKCIQQLNARIEILENSNS